MTTLVTFNVNSLKMRLPVVLDILNNQKPDILMIQEVKGLDIPEMELKSTGYHIAARTQKAYNGVLTATRSPQSCVIDALPGMETDEQARFISVTMNNTTYINIYAPNGNPIGTEKYTYKRKWLESLYTHLSDLRAKRTNVVIAGDFNIIPRPLDAAHPEKWTGDALFQQEIRDLYRAILALGYTDTLRTHMGEDTKDIYTFWDYQAGAWARNDGIRIDHILASPGPAQKLTEAGVDTGPRGRESPSDHTPTYAIFDF